MGPWARRRRSRFGRSGPVPGPFGRPFCRSRPPRTARRPLAAPRQVDQGGVVPSSVKYISNRVFEIFIGERCGSADASYRRVRLELRVGFSGPTGRSRTENFRSRRWRYVHAP
jgi:hypothetical protein